MKSSHPVVTLLGNNSGRNLGDMAIMSSIMESFAKRIPETKFFVPTINPQWVRQHYGNRYNVEAIDVMPWTGSVRLLGIPTLKCFAKSDVALICDGIIFGKKLFNPAFNYLITLVFLVPLASMLGCKVVCYSCGIGPFSNWISRLLARWTINGSDLVMMRERDSEKLARDIGVTKPIELTGDAAFINPVSSDDRAVEIIKGLGLDANEPILAINVTSYLDTWLKPGERLSDAAGFINMVADGINKAQSRSIRKFQPLVISTHPMDESTCNDLANRINGKVLSNSTFLSHDIQAVIRRCGLLIGMRFHSIVLASSVDTPVVGLIYAPKVRGYMRLLNCEEFGLELAGLTSESLAAQLASAWEKRDELKARQKLIIDQLKDGAERAADVVVSRYFLKATRQQGSAAQQAA